jgi:hypothetical protein
MHSAGDDMKLLGMWVVGLVLGAGVALLTGLLGVGAGAILFVLAVLIVRRERFVAWSGLLLGFGATWLAGLARQATSGGSLEDSAPWLALGIVPLAVGLLMALVQIARHGRTAYSRVRGT